MNIKKALLLAGMGLCSLSACKNNTQSLQETLSKDSSTEQLTDVSRWPRAVTYEIFVQSFADSDADSIGDFRGMTSKLDYLQDLGIKAIWLMPINPSPSYHKYDVTDYYDVHPDYGTLDEFKEFVEEAHDRDIKVVMDLVVNHSGIDHPWFQEAMQNSDSPYRNYYVWADKDSIADQIAKKETSEDSGNITQWHEAPGNTQSYYGYFWGGMPDLNFDNPEVRKEIIDVGRFWLGEVGVDGFRLDAARHIFPDDRAEDSHAWWEEFRAEMEKVNPEVYLVGEVWAPTEEVAPYLKGLHALFNFDMSYAMTEAAASGKAENLVLQHQDIRDFYSSVTEDYIDATFLTNHDQNRIMSELKGHPDKAKMAASLLFTLPGSPYIYYGEEIGMLGTKPDPEIREPYLWNTAETDSSRTRWMEAKHSVEPQLKPLALQQQDSSSIYHHYKEMIGLRNSSQALTYGELLQAETEEPQVVIFRRETADEKLLILHNLSDKFKQFELSNADTVYDKTYFHNSQGSTVQDKLVSLPKYSTLILTRQ